MELTYYRGGRSKNQGRMGQRRLDRMIAVIWGLIFLAWSLHLTGFPQPFFGSPGLLQGFRLGDLLQSKQGQIQTLHLDLDRLDLEFAHLEKNAAAIGREIRKTLGYVAPDEIIFDFSLGGSD